MKHTGFQNNAPTNGFARNDCTVRALASATNEDYMKVYLALEAAGRRPNSGFPIYEWLRANDLQAFGHLFTPATLTASGVYLVGNAGHVWVMKNGKLVDSWQSGRRYTHCYLVTPLPKAEVTVTEAERKSAARYAMLMQD